MQLNADNITSHHSWMIEMLCKLSCSHKHPDKHLIKNVIDDYIVVRECSVMEAEGIYSSNTWQSVEMLHKGFFWNFSDAAKSNFITTEKNICEQILLCSEWSQSASVKRAAFETRPGQKCRHVSVTSALGHDAAKGNNLLCEWWSRSETAGWGSLTDNWRLIHTPSVCLSLSVYYLHTLLLLLLLTFHFIRSRSKILPQHFDLSSFYSSAGTHFTCLNTHSASHPLLEVKTMEMKDVVWWHRS